MHAALKVLGHVVLLLMLVAMLYAGYISLENWSAVRV